MGFIRDLPRDLAAAFRVTLEELDEAALLLHVVDAADPDSEQQIAAVERILGDLHLAETPRLLVMNKIDRLEPGAPLPAPGIPVAAIDRGTLAPLLAAVEFALWKEGHLTNNNAQGGADAVAGTRAKRNSTAARAAKASA